MIDALLDNTDLMAGVAVDPRTGEAVVMGFSDDIPMPPDATINELVVEFALGLSTPREILSRFGVTDGQWLRLRANPTFRARLQEAYRELRADTAAPKRIKAKAALLLEDLLPTLYAVARDATSPLGSRLEAVKQVRDIAGVGLKDEAIGKSGDGFTVVINLSPTQSEKVVIEGGPQRAAAE
jgi:hypothetical protein